MLLLLGAGVVLLLPNEPTRAGAPAGGEGPAQLVARTSTKVSHADRAAIDRVLDRFLPAALHRTDIPLAWSLSGPELKAYTSIAKWRHGTTSVPAYPVAGTSFHYWTTIDAGKNYVIFNILLHPTTDRIAPYEFSGELVKEHGKWLVNRLYTIAIFNRVTKTTHEIGPADFAAPPAAPPPRGKSHDYGLIPLFTILGIAALAVPLAFGFVAVRRARRWKRDVRASSRSELPPLPANYTEPKKQPLKL